MENNHQNNAESTPAETEGKTESSSNSSVGSDNNQGMAILSYLGILVIIPIIVAKDSKFVMYHANQGLILLIAEVILVAIGMIPVLGWIISGIGWIVAAVFIILGIINAAGGKKKPLPLIGGYKILN